MVFSLSLFVWFVDNSNNNINNNGNQQQHRQHHTGGKRTIKTGAKEVKSQRAALMAEPARDGTVGGRAGLCSRVFCVS